VVHLLGCQALHESRDVEERRKTAPFQAVNVNCESGLTINHVVIADHLSEDAPIFCTPHARAEQGSKLELPVLVRSVQPLAEARHGVLKGTRQPRPPTFGVRERPASVFSLKTNEKKRIVNLEWVALIFLKKDIDAKELPDKKSNRCVFEHLGVQVRLFDPDHRYFEEITKSRLPFIVPSIMAISIKLDGEVGLVVL
jgi:hypothetical protein